METSKIAISSEAELVLDRMVGVVNDGFNGGKVSKVDLASWILQYFETHSLEKCREKIQQDHFDQVAFLESVVKELKQSKRDGVEMKNISDLLAPLSSIKNPKAAPVRNQRDNARSSE